MRLGVKACALALFSMVAFSMSSAPRACAQRSDDAPDETDTAAARALFEDGLRFSDAQDPARAADRFRRSLDLRYSVVVAYNLASTLGQIGRVVEASELLRPIIRDRSAPEQIRAAAQELLERVTPRIARLRVRIEGARERVDVMLDGEALPEALIGVPRPIDPGRHEVALVRDGESLVSRSIEIAEGSSEELSLEAPPPPVVADASDAITDDAAITAAGVPTAEPIAPGAIPTPEERRTGSAGVHEEAWFWGVLGGGAALGVAAAIIAVVVTSTPPAGHAGDFMPGLVEVGR